MKIDFSLAILSLLKDLFVFQVYAPTSNAEEAKVEWFYEDLQDLLELTPIVGDWNAKVGSGQTGDGKSERRHFRNQQTKMDWNG